MPLTRARRAVRVLLSAALAVWAGQLRAAGPAATLTGEDQTRVRGVLQDYRAAWLANDGDAVLRLFTEDAVLMPHHGVEPVVGKPAARTFWFPKDAPPTTITAFEQTIDAIGGSGDLAYVRGHSKVAWETGQGPEARRSGNAGTYLTLLRRQTDGAWRIALQMWDDPPNQPR